MAVNDYRVMRLKVAITQKKDSIAVLSFCKDEVWI